MKQKLFLSLFAAAAMGTTAYFAHANNRATTSKSEKTVYICTGKYAKTYHSTTNCRGLGNCQSSVKAVTQTSAEKAGRRAFNISYTTNGRNALHQNQKGTI